MSDADLTQYNGTSAFPSTADVGTNADTFLVPTDDKVITALSNIAGEAPVRRSIDRLKDYYLGLRGAVIGDFLGAVQKTLKSFYVDGTGGVTHTVTGGYGQALTAFLVGATGAIRAQLDTAKLAFMGTAASGSNPLATAAAPNTLDSLMVPKAWVRWETDGAGGITFSDGGRIASVQLPGASKVKINFATAFDSTVYAFSTEIWGLATLTQTAHIATTTALGYIEFTCGLDPATNQLVGVQLFFGRQTT